MDQQQLTTADRAVLSADGKVTALRPLVALGRSPEALTDWHRQLAAGVAAAHPLDGAKCVARGNHLAAQNDEPEIDRGPLTQPAELSEDDAALAFDLARNERKAEKAHERNDRSALELQLQQFRADGWL